MCIVVTLRAIFWSSSNPVRNFRPDSPRFAPVRPDFDPRRSVLYPGKFGESSADEPFGHVDVAICIGRDAVRAVEFALLK